jgi:chemotaxis protein methyltransferase CheR
MAFTFFFRDAQTLELAIDQALPSLRGRAFIHIWDAGCAHGPEPYTLAILLREKMSDYIFRNVRIHATDIDPSFASQVRSGIFTEAEVKRVPAEILKKYFRPAPTPGFVQVTPEVRERISFTRRDLLSLDPVREGFSLIICKNVLLHFEEQQRIDVLRMFHRALQPNGTLVMENTQKLPDSLGVYFEPIIPFAQVYRKLDRVIEEHSVERHVPRWQGRRRGLTKSKGFLPHFRKSHDEQVTR